MTGAEPVITEVLKDTITADRTSRQLPNKFLSSKTGWTLEALNLIQETWGPVDQFLT